MSVSRKVTTPEGSAAVRDGRRRRLRVEDLEVDRLGLGGRIDAELLDEQRPAALPHPERLGPLPGRGERPHQLAVARLSTRRPRHGIATRSTARRKSPRAGAPRRGRSPLVRGCRGPLLLGVDPRALVGEEAAVGQLEGLGGRLDAAAGSPSATAASAATIACSATSQSTHTPSGSSS